MSDYETRVGGTVATPPAADAGGREEDDFAWWCGDLASELRKIADGTSDLTPQQLRNYARTADELRARLSSVGASADTERLDNTVRAIAAAAFQAWERDEDSRVGRLLCALAGASGIRPDLDAARAALSQEARP